MPTQFEVGLLVGLLVGEGHFGGDGRQPQVTLRMHVRHEAVFRWLERTFPAGRLYGPYHHGGRHYLQWMARGSFLRDELAPLLDQCLSAGLDRHSYDRFQLMKARYPQLTQAPATDGESQKPSPGAPSPGAPSARAPSAGAPSAGARRGMPGPVPTSSGSAFRPGDVHGSDARSAPAATPAPDALADLFAQLREVWPA